MNSTRFPSECNETGLELEFGSPMSFHYITRTYVQAKSNYSSLDKNKKWARMGIFKAGKLFLHFEDEGNTII